MKDTLLLFVLCPFLVSAGLKFQEPPQKDHEWGFRPAEREVCRTTPAPFVWKDQYKASSYELQYARSADFRNARTVSGLRWCLVLAGSLHVGRRQNVSVEQGAQI